MDRYDVFISYNRKDASFVEFLIRCFESVGLRCFQDVTGLNVFEKLDASLKTAISRSRWLIAIVSPSYLQSYWCLFEAIEAIQGQDTELRFLPIVLRYSPGDQSLDEAFVLRALRDLDEQMVVFETEMIQMKAFDLADKLKKLQFVRAQLPAVFRQMHERIYPQFALWDDITVRSTLRQILARLAPTSDPDLSRIPLTFDRLGATPVVIPRLRELPAILWSTKVGWQAWKNSIVVIGNHVFVSSCGNIWNQPDPADGIYCLDAETGMQRWFTRTPSDANRLAISKGKLFTGCDDGTVMAVSAVDGAIDWQVKLDSAIVGGPLVLRPYEESKIQVVTYMGNVYALDLHSGREMERVNIGHSVIGDLGSGRLGHGDWQWVPTIDGHLVAISGTVCVHETGFRYADIHAKETGSIPELAAAPLLADGLLLQGLVRQTYYDDPPIFAIDARTGEFRWAASNAHLTKDHFGNLRSPPVVVGREVVFASAYTSGVAAVSIDDGRLLWNIPLSQHMFEQWSGPIARGSSVYLGRHDGYLHKINVPSRRRDWSVYLGDRLHAGTTVSAQQSLPEFQGNAAWRASGSAAILSTPVIDSDRLYVGTQEGYLYCIANLGEDGPAPIVASNGSRSAQFKRAI